MLCQEYPCHKCLQLPSAHACWSLAELGDIRKAHLVDPLISTTITALKNGKDILKQFCRQQDQLTLADIGYFIGVRTVVAGAAISAAIFGKKINK